MFTVNTLKCEIVTRILLLPILSMNSFISLSLSLFLGVKIKKERIITKSKNSIYELKLTCECQRSTIQNNKSDRAISIIKILETFVTQHTIHLWNESQKIT